MDKTNDQLINEIDKLKKQVTELEAKNIARASNNQEIKRKFDEELILKEKRISLLENEILFTRGKLSILRQFALDAIESCTKGINK